MARKQTIQQRIVQLLTSRAMTAAELAHLLYAIPVGAVDDYDRAAIHTHISILRHTVNVHTRRINSSTDGSRVVYFIPQNRGAKER